MARLLMSAIIVLLLSACGAAADLDPPERRSSTRAVADTPSSPAAPKKRAVPRVLGRKGPAARRMLARADFVVTVVREYSRKPQGVVIGQRPRPGIRLDPSSKVQIVLARALPAIPSLVGNSAGSARGLLKHAGFVWRIERRESDAKPGTVLDQWPAAGTLSRPGKTITLYVAKAPPPPPPEAAAAPETAAPSESSGPCSASSCLPPASDYDCAGGSGNGPEYVSGPITIDDHDPYDLDSDGDGVACE